MGRDSAAEAALPVVDGIEHPDPGIFRVSRRSPGTYAPGTYRLLNQPSPEAPGFHFTARQSQPPDAAFEFQAAPQAASYQPPETV